MKSLVATLVSAYFFTGADPQIMLDNQYKSYAKVQAFAPAKIEKYRDRIIDPKKKLPKSARLFIDTNVDWELYAKSIFRPNWDKLTKRQQKRFISVLQRDAIQRYGKLFSGDMKFSVRFNGPTEYKLLRGRQFAKVNMTIGSLRSDAEVDVSLIFHMGSERWALCDVYIDGVSKTRTYRHSVRKIYKKSGYEGVIAAFQKNNS